MPSFRLFLALFGALALLDQACGTQPCFRHSDCSSSEVCSSGSCVPAPVDVPITPIDGGDIDATIDVSAPPVDTGIPPTPDVVESGAPNVDAEAGDVGPTDSSDGDVHDATSEPAADSSPE
jgi:hypothetical protein